VVTAALLTAATAALMWPDQRAVRRVRLAAATGSRPARRRALLPATAVPVVPLAVAAAAAVAAAVSTPLVAVLAAVVAGFGARTWSLGRRDGREDAELLALVGGLGALAADLRSGRSPEAATDAAVRACGDGESGSLLARALRAPDLPSHPERGASLTEALDRISSAVRLSTRTGCSLASVVAAVEDDLRARRRHRQELRSATAGARASATLLAGLPVLGILMGSGVGADPWRVLTATGTGQVLLVLGTLLELAGVVWSRRLVERVVR
jgi:tight adherence protein B